MKMTLHKVVNLLFGLGMEILELVHGTVTTMERNGTTTTRIRTREWESKNR